MARLWSSGAELNGDFAELDATNNLTIVSTTVRSGTYSYNFNLSANNGYLSHTVFASNSNVLGYVRIYLFVSTLPSSAVDILEVATSASAKLSAITLNTDGTLSLKNSSNTTIGSSSAALSTNTWYRIELKHDATTNPGTLEAQLNGVSFSSGSNNVQGDWAICYIGSFNVNSTTNLFFDDIAINDSTGSFQNTWPGAGSIVHLRPNAAGDNADWSRGGTPAATNWGGVSEVTPNDATDFNFSTTLNQIDDLNIDDTPVGIGSGDTINVVQVGVRYASGTTPNTTTRFVLRCKAASAGTVEESSELTPPNSTYITNADASPRNYSLTLYDLPGASTTAWTKATLDTAQIGYRLSTDATPDIRVSTLWLLVDSTPSAAPAAPSNPYGDAQAFSVSTPSIGIKHQIIGY